MRTPLSLRSTKGKSPSIGIKAQRMRRQADLFCNFTHGIVHTKHLQKCFIPLSLESTLKSKGNVAQVQTRVKEAIRGRFLIELPGMLCRDAKHAGHGIQAA